MSPSLAELVVRECKASEFQDCDVVFSGLDSDVAGQIGETFCFFLSLLYILSDDHALHFIPPSFASRENLMGKKYTENGVLPWHRKGKR